jgi:hypothetical protein
MFKFEVDVVDDVVVDEWWLLALEQFLVLYILSHSL